MSEAERRRKLMAKKRKKLETSHQTAVEEKDKKQSSFGSVILKDKLPEGVGLWQPAVGKEHIIDILAWFATDNYPSDSIQADDPVHMLDLWVYRGVGANNDCFVSPSIHFKQKDPIQEFLRTNKSKEDWKNNSAKRRSFYLVWVHDNDEEEAKGVQVWEVSQFFFGSKIEELAKKPRGGGVILYSDYSAEIGKSIYFRIKESGTYEDAQGNKQKSIEYVGHQFVDRDADIPDEIIEQIFPLETVINLHPTYDEMYEAFYGVPYDPEKAPSKGERNVKDRFSKVKHKDEEDDIHYNGDFDDDDEKPVTRKKRKIEDDPEDDPDDEVDDDIDDPEDEVDDDPNDDPEDEVEDDPEEEPPPPPKSVKKPIRRRK